MRDRALSDSALIRRRSLSGNGIGDKCPWYSLDSEYFLWGPHIAHPIRRVITTRESGHNTVTSALPTQTCKDSPSLR